MKQSAALALPVFLLTMAAMPGLSQQQQKPPAVPEDPGVKVGARIPAFRLVDQSGKTQTLESLRGPKGLMLVFFRSADW